MSGTLRTAIALSLLATGAAAQEVSDCDWRASAASLVEPWEDHTATFANGDVRIALLDTVEPAAGAFHILVLSPPYDELGIRQCKVISDQDSIGFAGADFATLEASYNPATGLTFTILVTIFDPAIDGFSPGEIAFTLNQATGVITTSGL